MQDHLTFADASSDIAMWRWMILPASMLKVAKKIANYKNFCSDKQKRSYTCGARPLLYLLVSYIGAIVDCSIEDLVGTAQGDTE